MNKDLTIEIDEGSGFCFGVTTAIKKAEEELANATQLYCMASRCCCVLMANRLRRTQWLATTISR